MSTSKWRRRHDPKSATPISRSKRTEHPSPAYGSPAADAVLKRTDNKESPAWNTQADNFLLDGATPQQVNEILASNQKAFAARFASAGSETNNTPDGTSCDPMIESTLMPPPAAVNLTTNPGTQSSAIGGINTTIQLKLENTPQFQTQMDAAGMGTQQRPTSISDLNTNMYTKTEAQSTSTSILGMAQTQQKILMQESVEQQKQQEQQGAFSVQNHNPSIVGRQQQQTQPIDIAAAAKISNPSSSSFQTSKSPSTAGAVETSVYVNSSAVPPPPQLGLSSGSGVDGSTAAIVTTMGVSSITPPMPASVIKSTPSTVSGSTSGVLSATGSLSAPVGGSANGNPGAIPQGYTGPMGGIGASAQLGATAASTSMSSSSKRRSSSKKAVARGGGGRWTKEEDQKLRAAVAAVGPQNWKMIATEYLGDQRSDVQCLHRWQKVLQPGLVKGPWTKEEDQIIIDCIEAGITKWSEIAERIPGRIGKQCRERWFNHLDPSLKKGGWTEEEDAVLVEAQAKWGNSWTKIAKLLPGRSENAVKNRWNSATRRRQKAQQKTQEKLVLEAQAKVNAADAADKAAEAERGHSGGRGLADDEDTECVPKSAIALLRAKREQARIEAKRCSDLGLPPPEEAVRLGVVPASGGQPHQVPTMETAGMVGLAAMGQLGNIPTPMVVPIGGLLGTASTGSNTGSTGSNTDSNKDSSINNSNGGASSSSNSNMNLNSNGSMEHDVDGIDQHGHYDDDGIHDDEVVGGIHNDDGLDGLGDEASKLTEVDHGARGVPHHRDDSGHHSFCLTNAVSGGVGSSGVGNSVEHMLFGDSSLTEREKELIRRAYFAGIAQSGGPSPPHGTGRDVSMTASSLKLKLKRDRNTGVQSLAEQGSPVQWDFHSESQPQSNMSGSNIPVDFLREHGIEFDLTSDGADQSSNAQSASAMVINAGLSSGAGEHGGRLEDDLELSSSLLTMSLDKDIPMDEMALSAGEKSLLARPMAEDAMAALVRPTGHLNGSTGHLNTTSMGRRKSKGAQRGTASHGRGTAGEHSPAGPLANVAATQPEFGIESGDVLDMRGAAAGGGARPDISVRTGNNDNHASSSTASSASAPDLVAQHLNSGLSPTASMLHQLGDAYRDGLISDEQKAELKRSLMRANEIAVAATSSSSTGQISNGGIATVSAFIDNLSYGMTRSPNNTSDVGSKTSSPGGLVGLLDFDPSASADLANSGDLVDLVNSPNLLWSAGGSTSSSYSPSGSVPAFFKGNDEDLIVPVEQAAGVIS